MVAEKPDAPSPTLVARASRKAVGTARDDRDPDRPLTRTEEMFIENVLLGWPYDRCYAAATGSNAKKNAMQTAAWKVMQRPAVKKALAWRRATLDERLAMTRNEKRLILGNIAREPSVPALARIGAIQVDNRMTGDDEPKKTVGGNAALIFSVDPMRDVRRAESIPVEDTNAASPVKALPEPGV